MLVAQGGSEGEISYRTVLFPCWNNSPYEVQAYHTTTDFLKKSRVGRLQNRIRTKIFFPLRPPKPTTKDFFRPPHFL